MLLHPDPFSLGDANQIPALTSDFISTLETAALSHWTVLTTAHSAIYAL